MKYPSEIEFINTKNSINPNYKNRSSYNLDIWALSKGINTRNNPDSIQIDLIDATLALRIYFLPQILRGITFTPDVKAYAETIIGRIKHEEYVTYGHGYKFPTRGTKDKEESMLEESIFRNLSICFAGEFNGGSQGIRQFPANIFEKPIKDESRVSRKFWIDILTVNKYDCLSVIELKTGKNNPLDLFVQAIDYGIFAHLFKEHIVGYPFINNKSIVNKKVAIYLIADDFHPALVGDKRRNIRGVLSRVMENDLFDIQLLKITQRDGYCVKMFERITCNF